MNLNIKELTTVTEAHLVQLGTEKEISEASFDSRICTKNSLFVCIPGNQVDAHDFLDSAIEKGARFILGSNLEKLKLASKKHPQVAFLQVQDTLVATQRLAEFYRKKFDIPVLGVAGATGKTTTKDLIARIFEAEGSSLSTQGSLNNHWGVPQTILKLRESHQRAVFELGTNHFGEVASLSELAQPTHGIITTIGKEHLEFLIDERGSQKANKEMFDWMVKNQSAPTFLFHLDQPLVVELYEEFRKNKKVTSITYSLTNPKADCFLVNKKALGFEHKFGWEYEFKTPWGSFKGILPLPGDHNLQNALAAAACALSTKTVKIESVVKGLQEPKISKLRSNLFKSKSGVLVYDDSYNANPTSVAALFSAAREIRSLSHSGIKNVIAVLGDMLELGEKSAQYHEEMGALAKKEGVDSLFCLGAFSQNWKKGFGSNSNTYTSHAELEKDLLKVISQKESQTLVLIKGSRGSKMDIITKIFQN